MASSIFELGWRAVASRVTCGLTQYRAAPSVRRLQTGAISAVTFVPVKRTFSTGLLGSGQERRMRKSATRLFTLSTGAIALVLIPIIAPAKAATKAREEEKTQENIQFSDHRSFGQARPVTKPSSQAGEVCTGAARSFDCKQWPPSIDEDPDRKVGGAGGM
jgi:hypothetical protein